MKKLWVTGIAITLCVGSSVGAMAADSSKKEMTGASAGAVLGGAVGGPPGIVIGAAVGAMFGDRSHQKDVTLTKLTNSVDSERTRSAALDLKLSDQRLRNERLVQELQSIDESGVRELHALLGKGLEIDMPFRTNGVDLEATAAHRLTSMAALLSQTPGLAVQIDGFADPRGSVEYNAALSLERAEAVRLILLEAGVDDERMTTYGRGEAMTIDEAVLSDPDRLALERKVTVTFYRDDSDVGVAQLID